MTLESDCCRKPIPTLFLLIGIALCTGGLFACSPEGNREEKSDKTRMETTNRPDADLQNAVSKSHREDGSVTGRLPKSRSEETDKKNKLSEIRKIKNAGELKRYTEETDIDIRRAAVARLGEIGDPQAVKLLYGVFQQTPRIRGTDVHSGIMGDTIHALAQTRAEEGKGSIIRIVNDYIREGPRVKSDLAHIYDSQYYAVLKQAIKALATFPDDGVYDFLKSIADNPSLFYSLREKARESLLVITMKKKGLQSVHDKAHFLLEQIEPGGVLVEDWWARPGEKADAAIRERAVERLLAQLGWDVAQTILKYTATTLPEDSIKALAAFRVLSNIQLEALSREEAASKKDHIKAALDVTNFLSTLDPEVMSSETTIDIYENLYASAEILHEKRLWDSIKKVHGKIAFPHAWEKDPPTETYLGIKLPSDSVFIASLSSRTTSPLGTLIRACYFSDRSAADIVGHFEKATGTKAEGKTRNVSKAQTENYFVMRIWPVPHELEGFLETGVVIYESSKGFEEKAFGQVIRRGKTMFKITKFLWIKGQVLN